MAKPTDPTKNRPVQQRAIFRARDLHALELASQFKTQAEIGRELGISASGVCKLFQRIEGRLLAEIKDKAEARKAHQTLKLDYIAREGMRAWEASKHDAETEKISTSDDGKQSTERTKRGQTGDPRYLDQVRGALADIRKIWGLEEQSTGHGSATNVTIQVVYSDDFFGRDRVVDARRAVIEVGTEQEQLQAIADQSGRTSSDATTDEENIAASTAGSPA